MKALSKMAVVMMTILLGASSFAQESLRVKGEILRLEDGKHLKGAQITLLETTSKREQTMVSNSGKYRARLEYDKVYHLIYAADGYLSKKIEVDTRNIPAGKQKVLKMDIDVDLFKTIPGFNEKVLFYPISKAFFKHSTNNLGWDTDYYRERLNEIEAERARALDALRK